MRLISYCALEGSLTLQPREPRSGVICAPAISFFLPFLPEEICFLSLFRVACICEQRLGVITE